MKVQDRQKGPSGIVSRGRNNTNYAQAYQKKLAGYAPDTSNDTDKAGTVIARYLLFVL